MCIGASVSYFQHKFLLGMLKMSLPWIYYVYLELSSLYKQQIVTDASSNQAVFRSLNLLVCALRWYQLVIFPTTMSNGTLGSQRPFLTQEPVC